MWILILLLLILGLWLQWRMKQLSIFKELGIPGPKPIIIFGNMLEILKMTPINCYEQWMKKYGKVLGYYYGGTPTILLTDTDIIKQVFTKDFHNFTNRSEAFSTIPISSKNGILSTGIGFSRDKKRWKEIRSVITPTFTTSKLKSMTPIMNKAVASLIDSIEKKSKSSESFNIYDMYTKLAMDIISRTAFGIQTDMQNTPNNVILQATKAFFEIEFYSLFNILRACFPELGAIWALILKIRYIVQRKRRFFLEELNNQVKQIVHLRRTSEKHHQDLLQFMVDTHISQAEFNSITNEDLTAQDFGKEDRKKENEKTKHDTTKIFMRMADKEINDNCILFFLAGYGTTSTALAFTTHFLIHYPEIQEKLRKEIHEVTKNGGILDYNSVQQLKYLEQFIMESLRFYPPVNFFVNREAEEDIQCGQYLIKKGMIIKVPVYNINHDHNAWPNPEKFDPSRFSHENKANLNAMAFQTFGAGPRNCIGKRFAQLGMKLAIANILNKFRLVRTKESDQDPITLQMRPVFITPAKGIFLKAIPVD